MFPPVIPHSKAGYSRVTHPFATKLSTLPSENFRLNTSVRLACVRRAASVRPEPGSNSLLNPLYQITAPKSNYLISFSTLMRPWITFVFKSTCFLFLWGFLLTLLQKNLLDSLQAFVLIIVQFSRSCVSLSRWQLCYYSSFTTDCQAIFWKK